jgi:hypothetical protein
MNFRMSHQQFINFGWGKNVGTPRIGPSVIAIRERLVDN